MAGGSTTPFSASPPPASFTAVNDDDTVADVTMEEEASTASATPNKTSKKRKASGNDNDGDFAPAKKSKGTPKSASPGSGKRKANKNPNKARPMGRTYEQCDEHDKRLIDMKEAGASWDAIRKEWNKLTGEITADSTLPNRYSRLKSNFVIIKEEDNPILIEAKQEVEAGFEKEKWNLVAQAMKEKGTEEYRPDALARQYKKLMVFAQELQADGKGMPKTKKRRGTLGGDDEDVDGSLMEE